MAGSTKRKPQDAPKQLSKKQKTSNGSKKTQKSGRRPGMAADSLQWRKAKLPDMLNDAEGFFGLEEIDDVEIVRRDDNTVEFIAPSSSGTGIADQQDEPESDFEGFDDTPTETARAEVKNKPQNAGHLEKTKKPPPTKESGPKENKPTPKREGDTELESNVFASLDMSTVDHNEDDDVDLSQWVPLGLSPQLLSSLAKLAFLKPTPIQKRAIPQILEGNDVIGKAATGSGKTLAFAIPIVERWLDSRLSASNSQSKAPLALILSPTRELAHQITDHIKGLCAGLASSPYVCTVTGGLSIQKQQRQLSKADIVIGTPGRMWEVLSDSGDLTAAFRKIEFLVVDEADRLLTEGHFKEAAQIMDTLDRVEIDEDGDQDVQQAPRQTLVFSATFHKGLQQKLAGKGRHNLMSQEDSMEYLMKKLNFRQESPRFIDMNPISQMAERLKEGLVQCGPMEKDLYLYATLLLYPQARTLVFTNAISSVRRVAPMLQNLKLPVHPLHSEMHQKARLRSVEQFTAASREARPSILVATDVAARGLDIPGVDLVIHYHVPRTADAYVHRSGRTARAEKTGFSVLLCSPEEVTPTSRLIAKVHSKPGQSSKSALVRNLDMDRKLVSRLKPRVTLSKEISDAVLAKEKGNKEQEWMRNAADTLGVDYDSDEMQEAGNWGGRGSARKKKQKEANEITKAELGAKRAALRELLSQRINTGVSERYLSSGAVNMSELLSGNKTEFLGKVSMLDELFRA